MQTTDTYTGMIKATVLDERYNPVEQHTLNMDTKEGRYSLRKLANATHNAGRKLLTEPHEVPNAR